MWLADSTQKVPAPRNEPVLDYAPGSSERAQLETALAETGGKTWDIPLVIEGKRRDTKTTATHVVPHRHAQVLTRAAQAGAAETLQAIEAAGRAWGPWADLPFSARASVFLKAADLIAGKYRAQINASTMLGQGKTCQQAEIDAACELIDFLRFNVAFAAELYQQQPVSSPGVWNGTDLRPLEGFVLAVTPFNFTAIAGNLCAAPALLGNTVVWKPSDAAVHSGALIMQIFEEAGMPPGVINFIPGPAAEVVGAALAHPNLAGLHFTGSTHVFRNLWRDVGQRIDTYRTYPRLVGETGGKDFLIAHPSADVDALLTSVVRGGYEFQGQKCSALSRLYLPQSIFQNLRSRLAETIDGLPQGDVSNFENFLGAVINERAFDKHQDRLARAKSDSHAKIVAGGTCDKREGWFVRPSLVQVDDPKHPLVGEELFGPIVTLFVYPDADWDKALGLVDAGSEYGLTGAVFSQDRQAIVQAQRALRFAAGNFYVNDKPTGAVVGQQPFGGSRASGTNDKAGSAWNLTRWLSPRTVKETLAPPTDWRYPYMGAR